MAKKKKKKIKKTQKPLNIRIRNKWRGIYHNRVFGHRVGLSSRNHWHIIDQVTLSKINMSLVETLWLEIHSPNATVSIELVKNYKTYPAYKSGLWDGKSHIVRFPDKKSCSSFRSHWWNRRV